jgi:hypothetical protein
MVPHDFVSVSSGCWSGLCPIHSFLSLGPDLREEVVRDHLELLGVEPRGIEPSLFVYPDIRSNVRYVSLVGRGDILESSCYIMSERYIMSAQRVWSSV